MKPDRKRVLPALLGLSGAVLLLLLVVPGQAAPGVAHAQSGSEPAGVDRRFPDLRALPPRDFIFDRVRIGGETHHLLRFTAAVWNAGSGPLELRGVVPGSSRNSIVVVQRVYDTAGRVEEQPVGSFVHHPSHEHWHFEQFAGYELWSRTAYDLWAAGGRGEPLYRGSKTTGGEGFCVRDSEPLQSLPRLLRAWVVPPRPVYDECGPTIQGISVGWVDVYPYFLPEQWIDLGP
ncbi:MAG TPA: hypothetical protein VGW38_28050, partial [Chloroflexota bacterium]|nr:hypothetical protein [Chloroflexota bacterium]